MDLHCHGTGRLRQSRCPALLALCTGHATCSGSGGCRTQQGLGEAMATRSLLDLWPAGWDWRTGYDGCDLTAQGGGGSFKDRKPIGEVSSCDAWQNESTNGPKGGWGSLSLSLSRCLSFFLLLSVSVSISLSLYLCLSRSCPLSLSLSIRLPVYLFISLSDNLSIYLSTYLSMYQSIYLSVYLSIYLILSCLILSYLILSYPFLSGFIWS